VLNPTPNPSHRSLVVASYADGTETFELPDGATLIDLAQRLDGFVEAHFGAATNITVCCPKGSLGSRQHRLLTALN